MRILSIIHARDWRQRAVLLVLAWAVLTGILIAVGLAVVHAASVNSLDRHVTSVVVAHRSTALNDAMIAVTWLGSWVALVATAILLTVLVMCRRLPIVTLVLALIAWVGENGGTTLAKHVVGRDRPPLDLRIVSAHGWSWPSGHTAVALLVFTTLALVVTATSARSGYRTLAWILAAMVAAAVGYSRIELGVHWMTDVIASMIFVSAWLLVLHALFGFHIRPKREQEVDQAAADTPASVARSWILPKDHQYGGVSESQPRRVQATKRKWAEAHPEAGPSNVQRRRVRLREGEPEMFRDVEMFERDEWRGIAAKSPIRAAWPCGHWTRHLLAPFS